ncbi:MAG: YjgP/YjgQ family permease [Hyphomonadaceae bacterium]|nr:YjgP/YjgQ family permease [Hyphomonadaceae bacterium]
MGQLNTYLLRRAFTSIGGLVLFALAVLLLERILRIFEIVSSSTRPANDASQMVVNLLPHYLGIAIPVALMLGTIMTIDRFSRSSELTSAFGSGISLFHMTKPFLLIAIILSGLTVFIEGYFQPVGRYGYREVVHSVQQRSSTAALSEGKFISVRDTTFYRGTDDNDTESGSIFILEKLKDDAMRITSAKRGEVIVREESGDPVLQLENGRGFIVTPERNITGQLSFEASAMVGQLDTYRFRSRGEDAREMTTMELIRNRKGETRPNLSVNANNAALHLRAARAYLLLLLPFIAVPFGINYGRKPSSAGIFVGVVSLLTLQKALEFGQSLGAKGTIAPWMGIWPLMGIVTLSAIIIFRHSAYKMGQPPLSIMSTIFEDVLKDIRSTLRALFPSLGAARDRGQQS